MDFKHSMVYLEKNEKLCVAPMFDSILVEVKGIALRFLEKISHIDDK